MYQDESDSGRSAAGGDVWIFNYIEISTQGRATYTMEFKHYSEAPKNVAEAIINKK